MTPTPAELLALRHRVSDSVLLDWLDLAQLLPERPCHIETEVLRRHWCCTQPSVSRRITRLWEAGLLDFRSGGGLYRIRRLGRM
jgi:DNA-binding MarR family transcriptional regulator